MVFENLGYVLRSVTTSVFELIQIPPQHLRLLLVELELGQPWREGVAANFEILLGTLDNVRIHDNSFNYLLARPALLVHNLRVVDVAPGVAPRPHAQLQRRRIHEGSPGVRVGLDTHEVLLAEL